MNLQLRKQQGGVVGVLYAHDAQRVHGANAQRVHGENAQMELLSLKAIIQFH